jgi:hypothetical protein
LCGPKVLVFLTEMAFGGGDRFLEVFGDKGSSEPGPSGKVAGVDGFEPF